MTDQKTVQIIYFDIRPQIILLMLKNKYPFKLNQLKTELFIINIEIFNFNWFFKCDPIFLIDWNIN
jgi:hypothetical protein